VVALALLWLSLTSRHSYDISWAGQTYLKTIDGSPVAANNGRPGTVTLDCTNGCCESFAMHRQRNLTPSARSRRRARAGYGPRVHQPGLGPDACDHERLVYKRPVRHDVHFALWHRFGQERRGWCARSVCAARRARRRRARIRRARLSGSPPDLPFPYACDFWWTFGPTRDASADARFAVSCVAGSFLLFYRQCILPANIIKWSKRSPFGALDSKRMHLPPLRNYAG
jgi:hypothetical protein